MHSLCPRNSQYLPHAHVDKETVIKCLLLLRRLQDVYIKCHYAAIDGRGRSICVYGSSPRHMPMVNGMSRILLSCHLPSSQAKTISKQLSKQKMISKDNKGNSGTGSKDSKPPWQGGRWPSEGKRGGLGHTASQRKGHLLLRWPHSVPHQPGARSPQGLGELPTKSLHVLRTMDALLSRPASLPGLPESGCLVGVGVMLLVVGIVVVVLVEHGCWGMCMWCACVYVWCLCVYTTWIWRLGCVDQFMKASLRSMGVGIRRRGVGCPSV